MKILILGGYGVFGGRLAELLSDLPELELIIAGRNIGKARAFCDRYQGRVRVRPYSLDRLNIKDGLKELQPDLVVDASGPFQDYGAGAYLVVSACIDTGVNYLDFADAADFVFGVSQFDERAKKAGIFVLSGVSSFPVLTAAVLRDIAKDMDIVSVEGGIAPSPFAGIGLNVMRAVLSYAGSPVKLRRNGHDGFGIGLAESMRFTIAVPGRLPLRSIRFSLVDVPDLQVIPPEHKTMTNIWMGAGPIPEILHRLLNLLAKARHIFHLPSLAPLSQLFYVVLNLMKFGEHRGGMFVRARGLRGTQAVERSWHLLAEGNDGPYIPSMAIDAVIRKMLDGVKPAAGARPATHALELTDFDKRFAGRAIFMGFRGEESSGPLYREILGGAFEALPRRVKQIHNCQAEQKWTGNAEVRRGKSILARIICGIIGLPENNDEVPVSVTFSPSNGSEKWTRNFGGRIFSSVLTQGTDKNQHLIVERFGVFAVALALVVEGDRVYYVARRSFMFGLPLPTAILPWGLTFETEKNGSFYFEVEICAPFVGLIVSYKGILEPNATPDSGISFLKVENQ